MKLTFNKENLQYAINVLQKVVQNKVNSNTPGAFYITTKIIKLKCKVIILNWALN